MNDMNDLIFMPDKQQYYPTPHKIYEVTFIIGFIPFQLHLIDTAKLPDLTNLRKRKLRSPYEYLYKRYLCTCTLLGRYWIWHATDNPEVAETQFKEVQALLQQGETFEFKHLSGDLKPVRLSWRGIEFEW